VDGGFGGKVHDPLPVDPEDLWPGVGVELPSIRRRFERGESTAVGFDRLAGTPLDGGTTRGRSERNTRVGSAFEDELGSARPVWAIEERRTNRGRNARTAVSRPLPGFYHE
jgi:hypothetical protein